MENNEFEQNQTVIDNNEVLEGNDKLFAILGYFAVLWLIGLLVAPEKDHAFVKNHVNNAILLTIAGFANGIIYAIPILGIIVGGLLSIVIFVFWILALIAAIKGEKYTLPIVGDKITLIK
jgi:uncharacterized membrane protein